MEGIRASASIPPGRQVLGDMLERQNVRLAVLVEVVSVCACGPLSISFGQMMSAGMPINSTSRFSWPGW